MMLASLQPGCHSIYQLNEIGSRNFSLPKSSKLNVKP